MFVSVYFTLGEYSCRRIPVKCEWGELLCLDKDIVWRDGANGRRALGSEVYLQRSFSLSHLQTWAVDDK